MAGNVNESIEFSKVLLPLVYLNNDSPLRINEFQKSRSFVKCVSFNDVGCICPCTDQLMCFLSDGRRLHLQSYHSECFPILFSILLDGDASLSESMFKWTSFVIPRFSWKGIIKKDYAVFVSFYTQHKVPLAFAYPRPTVKTLLDYSFQCFPQNK